MNTARTGLFVVSPISITAGIAAAVLVGASAWSIYTKLQPATTASTDGTFATATNTRDYVDQVAANSTSTQLTQLGATILSQAVSAYTSATQNGGSAAAGQAAVQKFGQNIDPGVTYTTYSASDITTDASPTASTARVLSYRADLRVALEPLFDNKDFELDLFAHYIDSKDPKYLAEMRVAAVNYRRAIANTMKVVAPEGAASYQASILTAMSQFASTLDAMADNADDPFASAALLKSYTTAQSNMLVSFNGIGAYAAHAIL